MIKIHDASIVTIVPETWVQKRELPLLGGGGQDSVQTG